MAKVTWEPVKTIECERIHMLASLEEKRVTLSDSIADSGLITYHTLSYRCSQGVLCNKIGCACRWSCLDSDFDPFQSAPRREERSG